MQSTLNKEGFEIIEGVFTENEINDILQLIEEMGLDGQFGVREFLSNNLQITNKVFTKNLIELVKSISPNCTKSIKSIYFDKPPNANWIVNWHQDLTINLSNKIDVDDYKNWRVKDGRVIVQPPLEMLESIFTIRIHLDDCHKENGALRVIKKSHKNGVVDMNSWDRNKELETICEVKKCGVLLMKPLTLHSSKRTDTQERRRVIHIEFTDKELPNGLYWKEKLNLNSYNL